MNHKLFAIRYSLFALRYVPLAFYGL